MPGGDIMTEQSIGVNFNGKETQIPLLVPGMSQQELQYIANGGKPTSAMVDRAVKHAIKRYQEGNSPFAGDGESPMLSANDSPLQGQIERELKTQSIGVPTRGNALAEPWFDPIAGAIPSGMGLLEPRRP